MNKVAEGFSILIPVYNEEAIIGQNTERLIRFLDGKGFRTYEVILVDNGSIDGTREKGVELDKKHKKVRFFCVDKRGVGRAFKSGVLKARHDKIISVDMDLSVELDFVAKANKLLDEYCVVIGSKIMGEQKRSFLRKAPSFIYILLVKLLLGLEYSDYSMAGKGYRKSTVLKCLDRIDKGTAYVIEIIYSAKRNGGKLIELPVKCDDARKSKFNLFNESWYRFFNLIKLRIRE